MRVLILGGDGYLGWPTAMHLALAGHEVVVADNYLRRNICREEDVEGLFPVPTLHERARIFEERYGRKVAVRIGDLCDWDFMRELFEEFVPEGVVHYAEQPSAPYSMMSRRAARLTLDNNLTTTANLIFAVREFARGAHIVKLGTMGEYGTPNIDIEEGWIEIDHKGRRDRFLYPRQASSLYHTTKVMDTDLLWFYVRTWGLAVTDLMQGPVYGLRADVADPELMPFFNYDEMFGTVINRFLVQAVAGHPLTVYGAGGQTRGYINIADTVACVRLSLEQPAAAGELRIFNQFTETFSVTELAERVVRAGASLGIEVAVQRVENPRKEAEEHYYNPAHTGLMELGLTPRLLTLERLAEMMALVLEHKERIDPKKFMRRVRWA